VVLTLRSDFLSQAQAYRPLNDALQGQTWLLGPMSRDELKEAVAGPAKKQEVYFEKGLIERILDDVGDEPGNLPLLEFALTQLWGLQEGRWLTHAAYDAIGRVGGALVNHAEEVWNSLDAEEQTHARRALVQLVQQGVDKETPVAPGVTNLPPRPGRSCRNWPMPAWW
jgi:DNA polymerase III delta subunit